MHVERIWPDTRLRNYHYLVVCRETGDALAVDPWDANLVLATARRHGWTIRQILNTHHHHDHVDGNEAVRAATGARIADLELAVFGATHAEVGACLLGLWGLPRPILDIVRYHHRPGDAPEASRTVASAVHVAEALASRAPQWIDLASLEQAGCAGMVGTWCELAEATP